MMNVFKESAVILMGNGFDMNALQFYLEHVEETKQEREKFLRGEEVDLNIIPRHIYDSWVRSAALGVNPFSSDLTPQNTVLRNAAQLLPGLPRMLHGTDDFFRAFGFQIAVFDETGNLITDHETKALSRHFRSALESSIGTASSSVAFAEQVPTSCFGYQNFKSPFCRQFGVSMPFIHEGALAGIVTAILDPDKLSQELYIRAVSFLKMLEEILMSKLSNISVATNVMELFQKALSSMSDGLVLVSHDGSELQHNPVALKMLSLSPGVDKERLIDRLESVIQNKGKKGDPSLTLSISEQSNSYGTLYVMKYASSKNRLNMPTTEHVKYSFRDLLGEDPAFLSAKNEAFIVASTNAPVMLLGDTGVGKELFAQSIHNASPRKNKPFVAINCGSVAKDLLESELFGYEAGAFTGALSQGKIGVMEAASGGTLFLDEIESLPLQAQAALLRCLSSGFIRRIGSVQSIPIDLRLISATKVDLLSNAGDRWGVKFRPDLYYRLSTCMINIPRLSERKGDIIVLAKYLIEKERQKMGYSEIGVTESFWDCLQHYNWPGNVRELENVIARAVIFMDPERRVLDRFSLHPSLLEVADRNRLESQTANSALHQTIPSGTLKQEETLTLQRFLTKHNYNVKETAMELGISRQTLYRRIQSNETLRRFMDQQKEDKRRKRATT